MTLREEERRERLITTGSLLLGGLALVFVGLVGVLQPGAPLVPVAAAAGALLIVNAWALRRTRRVDRAALTLCLIVLGAVIAASWVEGGPRGIGSMWSVIVCLVAPLLLGPRLALVVIATSAIHICVMLLAESAGHVFPPPEHDRVELYASLILTTLFGATFACLAERSRRAALAARDAALASVEEARQARLALVENIDAVVYSVDRDLRLIAGNSWFQRLSRARGEPSLEVGQSVLDGLADDQHDDFRALFARALAGEHFAVERDVHLRAGTIACEIWFNPIRRGTGEIRGVTVLGRDISERRRARAALDRAHRDLARASHLAGKAEVASDVLHNVGNVLAALAGNFGLALERMQGCGVSGLARAVAMLSAPDLPPEKRRDLHAYLALLVTRLQEEQREMVSDLRELEGQLDRVKLVIARQEEFAHPGGSQDVVTAEELLADVLALCGERLDRHGVTVSADGGGLPPLVIDRHKVVEVLACFVANSREALKASSGVRRLDLRAACTDRGWLRIEVADTGVGFGPEVGERLFTYGFTTRADGHGLGLAGALLAARTMGGTAHGKSDGPGRGATFSLEVPFQAAPDHLQRSIA